MFVIKLTRMFSHWLDILWSGPVLICIVPVGDAEVQQICKLAMQNWPSQEQEKYLLYLKTYRCFDSKQIMKEIAKLEKEYGSAMAASSNVVCGALDVELIVELEQSFNSKNDGCVFAYRISSWLFYSQTVNINRLIWETNVHKFHLVGFDVSDKESKKRICFPNPSS